MSGSKKANSTNSETTPTTRKRQSHRIWTVDEELKIAHYMVEKPYLGKNQAKETLAQYERKMLGELELPSCDHIKLKNKCQAMRKKYDEIKKWISQTGQGIEIDNPNGFQDVVKEKCSYYYILDEVLGTSQAINTSYQRSMSIEVIPDVPQNEINLNILEEVSVPELNSDIHRETFEIIEVESSEKCAQFAKFQNSLTSSEISKKSRSSCLQKLNEAFQVKCDSKVQIEQLKLDFENKKWNEMKALELEKARLEFDKSIELAKINKEVEMKRLEIEEKKLQVELLKLQRE